MKMPDIRKRVEEDRGLLKRIQLHVPGFAGYRRKEDLRASDNLLRVQLAKRLGEVRDGLEECRRVLVAEYDTDELEDIGGLINKLQTLEGKVRHAEQGYTGISPAVRIEEATLEHLYEYDWAMIDYVITLEKCVTDLRSAIDGRNEAGIKAQLGAIRARLADFDRSFDERIERSAGIFNF
jgi:hypothetical protein